MTHLSAENTTLLLERFVSWLNPNGIAVTSLHGPHVHNRLQEGAFYIQEERVPSILADYRISGYGYADYKGQNGYGISVSKPAWTVSTVEKIPGCRLVSYSEETWDRHHDILAVQRIAS